VSSVVQCTALHCSGLIFISAIDCAHRSIFILTCFMYRYSVTEVKVWGRGVDLERFTPRNRSEAFRSNLGIPTDCPLILYVGRLVSEKRIDIVADVVKRLAKENVNFRCIIVGAGPFDYLIENLPHTSHLGWLSGDELTTAYASSDIFLFPSSVETFGNVTLEASASGLPLVVESNCSGHLVDHGENGYACEAGDVYAFYQGTLELAQSAEMRAAFSLKSLEKSSEMDQHKVVREMLNNYQEVRHDFYHTYGGNHYTRDEAYNKAGSFKMGMDPRPVGWFIVEFIVLAALKLAHRLIAFATWMQEGRGARASSSAAYAGVNTDEDIEAQASSPTEEDDSTFDEEEEETGPGLLCGILIAIGDSPITAACVVLFISLLMFFSRIVSIMRRGCTKRLFRRRFEPIEHRMDAAFNPDHVKRKE